MRLYGSVQVCFWENINTQKLSDQAKLLAIYLLTGPHSNMLGCFRLPDGYITEDLKWSNQTVKSAFEQLGQSNLLTRDADNAWVVVHDFLKWNPVQNPRQGIGIQKLFSIVPHQSCVFKPLLKGLLTHAKYLDKGFVDQLQLFLLDQETLSEECVADKDQNQDQDQEQDQNQNQDQEQKEKSLSGKPDIASPSIKTKTNYKHEAIEVLDFLNLKTGRAYRPVEANLKLIEARLKSGASVMDCRQVIVKKTREWKGDKKMAEYLRPATLFNQIKFEQYMGELVLPKEGEAHDFN